METKIMCIQSYYKNQNSEEEIELDLLKEIKDVGIEEWNKQVSEEKAEIKSDEAVKPQDKKE